MHFEMCDECHAALPDTDALYRHNRRHEEREKRTSKMARYYKNPADGKIYNDPGFKNERRTMLPPTELQKERVKELKDRPEFAPHLDWLIERITKYKALETRGAIGSLINDMKERLREAGVVVE